jgi:hypothetical protein
MERRPLTRTRALERPAVTPVVFSLALLATFILLVVVIVPR